MENVSVQLSKPKTTPKDFFLWLGAMAALYVSVVSFIVLLYQYINVLFPDQVFYSYDPYSSGMRFAIASLVIVFPLYFYLTRTIQNDLRAHPDKRELGIRKWLIYITLFIGGVTLAGDLVVVLYTFLGGELTARFLLKALALFVVIGAAFFYYLKDLKGYWVDHKQQSLMAGYATGSLMAIAVIGAFFIVGTPGEQRDLRLDADRRSDLSSIQWQIINYWQAKGEIPATLEALEDPIMGYTVPTDPETGESYGYTVTGEQSFELCATFARASIGGPQSMAPMRYPEEERWVHDPGEHCFDRTIDSDIYPVREGSVEKPIPPSVMR